MKTTDKEKKEKTEKTDKPKKKTPTKNLKVKSKTEGEQVSLETKAKRKPWGIAPYVVSAIAIFILITYFLPDTGVIGPFIRDFMFGLFGGGAYLVPFYMIFLAASRKRDKANGMQNAKIAFAVGSFISILIFIQLVNPATTGDAFFRDLYNNGKDLVGAGVIGGTVGIGIEKLIGFVPSIILSSVMAFVLLVFLFGSTPMKVLRKIAEFFKSLKPNVEENDDDDDEEEEEKLRETPKKAPKKAEKPFEPLTEEPAPKEREIDITVPEAVATVKEDAHKVEEDTPPAEINREDPYGDSSSKYKSIFNDDDDEAPVSLNLNKKYNLIDESSSASLVIPTVKPEEKPAPAADIKASVEPEAVKTDAVEPESAVAGEIKEEGIVTETVELDENTEPPYVFPPISLLGEADDYAADDGYEEIAETGRKLIAVLESYGVKAKLVSTSKGPTVTRYEVLPDAGVRVNKIANLSNDIRMRIAAESVRIETNIPGKAAIGIEIPNKKSRIVKLRSLIENPIFQNNKSKLFVCLGVGVGGNPVYFDIADMPHLLVAGATGQGKSVCINSIITSLLYRAKPDEVKLVLIDPKKVEFTAYSDIPHLSVPIVTDARKAAGSLNWAVVEMEKRYTLMQEVGVQKIDEYNAVIEGDPEREKLPYVVIIIDEFADLITTASDAVENSVQRLSQMARAAGIYLIIGTQRPTVDVITGTIKANIPSRIAFTVRSLIDSRTIIDVTGAEKLCGKGDMLFVKNGSIEPIRVQGTFISGFEVNKVCTFVRNIAKASYDEDVIKQIEAEAKLCGTKPSQRGKDEPGDPNEKEDPLFLDAIGVAFEFETMSTSLLQRKLSVGYSRAQKMIDMMESRGYVGKFDTQTKKRKIIITFEEYQQLRMASSDDE